MYKKNRHFVLAALIFLLSACGYHLRGDIKLTPNLQDLVLTASDDFALATWRQLLANENIPTVVNATANSQLKLNLAQQEQLLHETSDQHYRMYLNQDLHLCRLADNVCIEDKISVQLGYINPKNNPLAANRQQMTMQQQLQRQLLTELKMRLQLLASQLQ